jgi:hypothetical protein
MLKSWFLTLFTLLLMLFNGAFASPYVMTHERYVHLTDPQKEELIIKTMEMMVQLEARYKYAVQKQGYNWERFRTYTKLMHELEQLLLSSAHAQAGQPNWNQHFENFVNMTSGTDSNNRCLYGGWVSRLTGHANESERLCMHPSLLANNLAEKRAFQNASNCGPPSEKISCNPVIFGYKQASAGTLFCVEAGPSNSKNSALECMRAALDATARPNTDSKDQRLADIRLRIDGLSAANRGKYLEDVHTYLLKTCVCREFEGGINLNYQDRIREHRTCYGMLNMVAANNQCETSPLIQEPLFAQLKQFFLDKNGNQSSYDRFYVSFLDQVKDSADVRRICGLPPADEGAGASCSATCTPKDDGKKDCVLTITRGNNTRTENLAGVDLSTSSVQITEAGQQLTCPLDANPDNGGGDNGNDLTCSLTTSVQEGEGEARQLLFTISFSSELGEQAIKEVSWSEGSIESDNAKATYSYADEKAVTATVTLDGREQALECAGSFTADRPATPEVDDEQRKISVTITSSARSTNVTLTATVNNTKELKEGESIVWTRQTTSTSTSTTTQTGIVTAPDGDQTEGERTSTSSSTSGTSGTNIGEGWDKEVSKENRSYQVCADLMKGGSSKSKDCKEIPARPAPQQPGGPMGPQGPGFMPRQGVNTRADGIN